MMQRGKPMGVLKQTDLLQDHDIQIHIENYRFLASYNWTKAKEPTIFVPGTPALWKPLKLPVTLSKDDGNAIINENSDRILAPSFAPFFATLLIMQPSYSFSSVSLVSDRNSLRKLLDFASGRPRRNWRMEAEVVNNTLFLTRWENDKVQIITGSFNSGYGHEFEKRFLKFEDGLEESCAHHRIVEYEIGGMKWAVRFEADGYLEQGAKKEVFTEGREIRAESQLSTAMGELVLEADSRPRNPSGVTVIRKGHLVPEASVIEIKCKSANQFGNQTGDNTIQCWLAQTEAMLVGRHREGVVERINTVNMLEKFDGWEKGHQSDLRLLVCLIKEIRKFVGQAEGSKCCLVCNYKENPRVLRFFKSNDNRLTLSAEVKERYWGEDLKRD